MKRGMLGLAALLGVLVALAFPAFVSATVNGGCRAEAHSTSGGSVDVTTQTEWHLKSTDIVGGSGTAPSTMTSASVWAYALGVSLPIASGSGAGGTTGSVDNMNVAPFAVLGQRFTVAGSASGPTGSCSGQITIILDDVNPLMTVLGGGGVVAGLVGAAVVVSGLFLGGGLLSRLLGGLFGGLGGVGLALALQQFGVLDPTTLIGLVIPGVGLVAGVGLPGLLHSSGVALAQP